MRKNATATLILGVVFVALLGWYFGYEKNLKTKSANEEEKAKQILSLKAEEIQELEFTRMKGAPETAAGKLPEKPEYETIKLKKNGESWLLTSPVQDDAENSIVQQMANTLAGTKQERVVDEDPKKLEVYGLNPPLIKIVARKDATTSQEVHIGFNTEVGYSSYAKIDGKPAVYKTSRAIRTAFDKDIQAVRTRNIMLVVQNQVSEVEIQNPKENIVVKRGEKETWTLARENMLADSTQWNKALTSLLELKIVNFVSETSDKLAEYGLDKPYAKYWITKSSDKSKIGVWLGKAKNTVFAKREDKPMIFEVEKLILSTIDKPGTDYRNLALAQFNRFDVKRIKIEHNKESVELLKDGSNWTLPVDPKAQVDTAKVDTLLTHLQDIKVGKFLSEKPVLAETTLTIRLFEQKEAGEVEKVTLKFGKPQREEVRGTRNDLSFPFVIKIDELTKLKLSKDNFLKKDAETPAEKKS